MEKLLEVLGMAVGGIFMLGVMVLQLAWPILGVLLLIKACS